MKNWTNSIFIASEDFKEAENYNILKIKTEYDFSRTEEAYPFFGVFLLCVCVRILSGEDSCLDSTTKKVVTNSVKI